MTERFVDGAERTVGDIIAPARDKFREIPRSPSPEMLAAPLHVALATFAQPRIDLVTGRYVGWVIVIDVLGEQPRVRFGGTAAKNPVLPILTALHSELHGLEGSSWISLSRQRKGLAVSLQKAGYPVTTSFGVGNRAETLLRKHLAEQIHRAQRDAARAGAIEDGHRARRIQASERTPEGEVFWWPADWRVGGGTQADRLIVATDAALEAVDFSRVYAIAAVTEDGDCALNSGYTQSQIGEVELEALILGLELVAERAPKRATILNDNREAIEIARRLSAGMSGKRRREAVAGCSHALRERYERAWLSASLRTLIEFEHVRGHDGHILNEAADAIASSSRRASMIPRVESERTLNRYIDWQLEAVTGFAHPGSDPT